MEPPAPALAGGIFPAEQSGKPQGKQVSLVSFLKLERCHACEQPLKLFRCSVPQSCPTVCDPTHCSTPGLPVHHQPHVHRIGDAIQPSHPLCPLLLPPSIFPSIRVFSSESALCIRWPKYWNFSFSISPSNESSGLISFRMDWFDLLAVQGTLKSLLQHQSSKASVL